MTLEALFYKFVVERKAKAEGKKIEEYNKQTNKWENKESDVWYFCCLYQIASEPWYLELSERKRIHRICWVGNTKTEVKRKRYQKIIRSYNKKTKSFMNKMEHHGSMPNF